MEIDKTKELKKYDLDAIKLNPEKFAKETTIANGINLLKLSNYYYYYTPNRILSDSVYDKIEEILKERFPKNKFWKEIRDWDDKELEKVKLPYWMGSMDKIKPNKNLIEKWSKKYTGNYLISEKLDGMSCLLVLPNEKEKEKEKEKDIKNIKNIKLYSRGDGEKGNDISQLLKYLNIFSKKKTTLNDIITKIKSDFKGDLVIRGEILIKKSVFNEKYKDIKNDPRSMVAGLINAKHPEQGELEDLDLVSYEVIEPSNMVPKDQFELLEKYGFNTPRNELIKTKTIEEELLIKMLEKWKKESQYEIDGLIITQNLEHERNTSGNPDYSRAFKMDLEEQRGIGEVEEILWEVSRHGKVIPRIKIKPLKIGGVVIQKATAFNAKYIQDNKLGPGAVVNIIRSGDVIPYIEEVVKPAPNGASMPEFKYKWHPGGYDIYIDSDIESDTDILEIKKITYFMTTLEAEGISQSTIKRYYDAGYKTLKDILEMTESDLLELPNTKEKLATKQLKVLTEIKETEYPLDKLMAASGVFDLGFGSKKAKLVLEAYPDILTKKFTKMNITEINGFEEKTADLFLKGLEKFKKWLLEHKLKYIDPTKLKSNSSSKPEREQKLKDLTIVMTGFRDKELEKLIEELGGTNTGTVTSKTSILIAKDVNESGGKLEKARKLKIPIMTVEEFKNTF
jgi:DNA ligase (NAD+)